MKFFVMILGVLFLVCGCTRKQESGSVSIREKSNMPADLIDMQGGWHSGDSGVMCEIFIEAFTIRLSITGLTDDECYKQNACIKQIDSLSGTMEIYGDKNPWYYVIVQNDKGPTLDLRFFDAEKLSWVSSHMHQQSAAERVASR